jgi:hypothetical protein
VVVVQTQVVAEQVVIAVLSSVNPQVVVLPQNPCSLSQWALLILSQLVPVAQVDIIIHQHLAILDQILYLVQLHHWAVATGVLVLEMASIPMVRRAARAVADQQGHQVAFSVSVAQELQGKVTLVVQVKQITGQVAEVAALAVWAVMPLVTTLQTLQTAPAMAV